MASDEVPATMIQILRVYESALETFVRTCLQRGFHVALIERPDGDPQGSEERPVIVRGAGGKELARIWLERPQLRAFEVADGGEMQFRVRGRLCAEVHAAAPHLTAPDGSSQLH